MTVQRAYRRPTKGWRGLPLGHGCLLSTLEHSVSRMGENAGYFFVKVSTTAVLLRRWASLTEMNRPVLASLPTWKVLASGFAVLGSFLFAMFDHLRRVSTMLTCHDAPSRQDRAGTWAKRIPLPRASALPAGESRVTWTSRILGRPYRREHTIVPHVLSP